MEIAAMAYFKAKEDLQDSPKLDNNAERSPL